MRARVICISHTEGAGGEEVARALADRIGYRYVDDEIILSAAEAEHALPEAVALAETRRAGRTIEVDFHRFENTENLRMLIRGAVYATADQGEAVIVAHAASFALADRDDVLRVFITASEETRQHRLAAGPDHDEKTAHKHLKESEKNRAAYLKRFYGVHDEHPTHYDLLVNTDKLPTDAAVAAIVSAAS